MNITRHTSLRKAAGKMVFAALLCMTVICCKHLALCRCTEWHFIKRREGNITELVISASNTSHVKRRDVLVCANSCLASSKCNSYFYNIKNRSCVLHHQTVNLTTQGSPSEWRYWVRKDQNAETVQSALLIFAPNPVTLNLDTLRWTQKAASLQRNWTASTVAYDRQTRKLFWSEDPPSHLYSASIQHYNDLSHLQITKLAQAKVQGISLAAERRLLIYLRHKDVVTLNLTDGETKVIASFPDKKPFSKDCRTVVYEPKKAILFHFQNEKLLYGMSYTGSYSSSPTTAFVSNLVLDIKAVQVIWTATDYKSVWVLSLNTYLERKLMENRGIYYLFPLHENMFMWDINRPQSVHLLSGSAKAMLKVPPNPHCTSNKCQVTAVVDIKF